MFELNKYLERLLGLLKGQFGARLLYAGLQGSYLRDEAGPDSDIDIMIILDDMTVGDLDEYKELLHSAGCYERSCGFICGKDEMLRWNPLEICHLVHTTKDIYGTLADLVPAYTAQDVIAFIRLSIGNLYHELCHRYIHSPRDKSIAMLPVTYKSVFFILQNLYYVKSGTFFATKRGLSCVLEKDDRAVLEAATRLTASADYDFDTAFGLLFTWCQSKLKEPCLITVI